jgi:crotonobetainyl-CoA:carnitine CoA-transferase CaiB-like acyl-CoA transferase
LRTHGTAYWVEKFNSSGIPSGAILSLEEALTRDQIRHRQTLRTVHAEDIGDLELFNATARFSKTPGNIETPPPKLSEHTNQILDSLGYSTEKIAELREAGVI